MKTIDSLMQTRVVSVEMDDTLRTVRGIFERTRFHHLLVIGNDRLAGVLSDRDLLKAISPFIDSPSALPRDDATLNKRVHQIMTRKPITLPPGATTGDAAGVMLEHHVSCIPVVNAENAVLGIVTWRDLLTVLHEERAPT